MKTSSKAGNVFAFTFCYWAVVIGSIVTADGRLAPAYDQGEAGEWHTTLWEPCEPEKVFEHLPNGPVAPIVGLQRRTVTCVSSNATVLPDGYCRDTAVSQRRCVVTQRCQVDSWSPWETTQQGCRGDDDQIVPDIQMRRRRILQAPMGPTRAEMDIQTQCPTLQEVRIVQDPAELPLCSQRYKWQHSPWSPCRPETSTGAPDAEGSVCGGGIQFRSLSCFRLNDSRPVHQRLCRGLAKLPVVQHCEIPCDLDCQVTNWSPWSACIGSGCHLSSSPSTDSAEMDEERLERYWSGYRLRYRRAVSNASAAGVECPPMAQAQRCRSQFTGCTRWQVRPLETCHLVAANATCGPGYQDVVFQCQRYDGTILDDQLCANVTLPATNQVPCRVVCSTDCVLSDWSNWTRCSESDGKRRRWRHVIGYPMTGAASCPPLGQLVQEEICSPAEREAEPVFSWWTLPWTDCLVANRSRQQPASILCGTGYQQREVRCIKNDVEHVDDSWCSVLPEKPSSWRSCDVPCPVDCQTSPWSEWSACSSADALEESIQTRMRVVLLASSSGGAACPPLIEKRSCFDRLLHGSERDFHWHVGAAWSPCQLSPEVKCGTGITTRSAYCRDASNRTVDPSLCLSQLVETYSSLQLHRECHVTCPHRRCAAPPADWTQSSPPLCTRNCMGTRKRRHEPLADDGADGCPYGDISEDCPCERITLETEEWSQCLLDDQRTCGAGRQFRRRKCTVTATAQLAPLHWCNEDDYETRYCEVACPIDCQMSPWSKWTPCNSICGPGIQRRHRSILVEPAHDGRPCGPVEEIQPCEAHPCDLYQWQSSDWTPCYLDDGRCGSSTQHRTVRCVNVLEDAMVHESLCDPANKPATSQTCQVSCPGECVLTQWSPWTACNKCQGSRSRQRSIIRNPIYNRTCGPLEEIQPCSIEFRNCWTYEWQVSDWGSCIPLGGSQCGEGTQARALSCVRNDGYPVHISHCDSYTRPALTEQWCTVECPIDCQLSPWSPWNQSECTCGNHFGVQIRQRQILIDGNAYGRQCPPILRQHLPCPYRPCYDWRPANWTQCLLQGGQCGKGVRRQLVDCVLVETQKKVDPEFCLMSGRSWPEAAESACSVPCRFEMAVKIAADAVPSAASVLPTAVEDEIRVFYYPSDEEFNIWMVAMIGMGSLFLVFVGVTIFLICSSKNDPARSKASTSAVTTTRPTEFRTTRGRHSNQQLPEA